MTSWRALSIHWFTPAGTVWSKSRGALWPSAWRPPDFGCPGTWAISTLSSRSEIWRRRKYCYICELKRIRFITSKGRCNISDIKKKSSRYSFPTFIVLVVVYNDLKFAYTGCPRSSDPFRIVSYYKKWGTTSWTYSTFTHDTEIVIVISNQYNIVLYCI